MEKCVCMAMHVGILTGKQTAHYHRGPNAQWWWKWKKKQKEIQIRAKKKIKTDDLDENIEVPF